LVCVPKQSLGTRHHRLGMFYFDGSIKQDYIKALKWTKKAAEQGMDEAQYNLGIIYYNGYGIKQNYLEAEKWIRKAAEQGLKDAQYNLGVLYYNGEGVKSNTKTAIIWLKKASAQGHKQAEKMLHQARTGFIPFPPIYKTSPASHEKLQ